MKNQKITTDPKNNEHSLPKKILIVDDDPGIRDVMEIIFTNNGYLVELKDNGKDMLDNAFSLPQLFLVDRQLSGYSGLDICRHLKKQEQTKNIPVIMISASPDIKILSKQAGADAWIEKPFEIEYLLKIVNQYINAG